MDNTVVDICCIVVTCNRLVTLEKTLLAYENQILKPKYLVVIDNNSKDGTKEYLKKWELDTKDDMEKHVIFLDDNIGGAGGFYTGFKYALTLPIDWIWVADDDAYPSKDAIFNLNHHILQVADGVSALCGAVWEDGKISTDHRRRYRTEGYKLIEESIPVTSYNKQEFLIDLFSYVGTIIRAKDLKKAGLTNKDYFIHCDDTEHSLRVGKVGKIVCFPDVKIMHEAKGKDKRIDWRYYYDARNRYAMLKEHFPHIYRYEYLKDKIDAYIHIALRRRKDVYKIKLDALMDADKGVLGRSEIYKPGFKLNSDW